MDEAYIKIVKDKNGKWDFRVSTKCTEIKREELDVMRSTIITAICVAEGMITKSLGKEPVLQVVKD